MRISIVTGAFAAVPPAPGGAVERRWFGVAKVLATMGHAVTLVGCTYNDLPGDSETNGVRIIRHTAYSQTGRIPFDLCKDFLYALRILRLVPSSDVLITNDFCFPLVSAPFRKEMLLVNVARMPKGQMFLYKRATGFIVPSRAIERAVVAEKVPQQRVVVLGNPIDVDVFTPPPEPRDFRMPLSLLYAGRIHPEKGIEILISAVRQLVLRDCPIQCRIIGPYQRSQGGGGVPYRDDLVRAAEGLPVEFSEPIFERQALADVYRACDLFVYPSVAERGESFGVAPVEAMATGAVPVVSALPCFDEFMIDGVGARFDHRDSHAGVRLAEAIATLLEAGDLETHSEKATRIALQFSYPNVAAGVIDAIEAWRGGDL